MKLSLEQFMDRYLAWRHEAKLDDEVKAVAYLGYEEYDHLRHTLHAGSSLWSFRPRPEGGQFIVGGCLIVPVNGQREWLAFGVHPCQ